MEKMIVSGRIFFSIALIVFGIQNCISGDFVMARSVVLPAEIPGRLIAAYFSGVVLFVAGLLMIFEKKAGLAAMLAAVIIFLWAFMRNIPQAVSVPQFGGLWTNTFKTLAIGGGALIAAASYPSGVNQSIKEFSIPAHWTNIMITIGRILLGIFLFICGIQHFMFIDFVAGFIPSYIPAHFFWAYFAGAALLAGGAGLLLGLKAPLAATLSAIMIFLWVILLHIPMAVMKPNEGQSWTSVCEALAISGILFILAGMLQKKTEKSFQGGREISMQ